MKDFLLAIWPKAKPHVYALAMLIVGAVLSRLGVTDPAFNVVGIQQREYVATDYGFRLVPVPSQN